MLIFFKYFNATEQTLLGVGKTYAPAMTRVADLDDTFARIMRWPRPLKIIVQSFEVRRLTLFANTVPIILTID